MKMEARWREGDPAPEIGDLTPAEAPVAAAASLSLRSDGADDDSGAESNPPDAGGVSG